MISTITQATVSQTIQGGNRVPQINKSPKKSKLVRSDAYSSAAGRTAEDGSMSLPRKPTRRVRLPSLSNDNQLGSRSIRAVVEIPSDLPITQSEIDVFSALLDDWDCPGANDNQGPGE